MSIQSWLDDANERLGSWLSGGNQTTPTNPYLNVAQIQTPTVPTVPTVNAALLHPNPYQIQTPQAAHGQAGLQSPAVPTQQGSSGRLVDDEAMSMLGSYRRGLDAERTDAGPTLWTDKRTGKAVNPGDILPNLQEVFLRPISNNIQVGRESLERSNENAPEDETELQRRFRQANDFLGAYMSSGTSVVPQIVMNALQYAAQETESVVGTLAMSEGQSVPNYLLNSPGMQVAAAPLRMGLNVTAAADSLLADFLSAQGHDDMVEVLRQKNAAPIAERIATLIAVAEERGMDTGLMRSVLDFVSVEPDVLIENARAMRGAIRDGDVVDNIQTAMQASHFAYEDPELQMQALERIRNGEDAREVYRDINSQITLVQRMKDIGLQLALDPLNLMGVGVDGRALNQSRAAAMTYMVDATDDAEDILRGMRVGNFSPDGELSFLERALPFLTRRTPASRSNFVMNESGQVLRNLSDYITPNVEVALRQAGVMEHPGAVLLDLLRNPLSDDVLGSGLAASQVREIIGIQRRMPTAFEVSQLGVNAAKPFDILQSRAAIRTREILNNSNIIGDAEHGVSSVAQLMTDLENSIDAARTATNGREAKDLLNAADDIRISIMDRLQAAAVDATSMENEFKGVWKGLLKFKEKVNDPVKGMFAYLHMHIVPGFYVKNAISDSLIAAIDGMNMLTPMKTTAAQLSGYNISVPIREAGQRLDAIQGTTRLGVSRWMDTLRGGERARQERVFLSGWERFMNHYYPDVVMNSDEYARLTRELGDRTLVDRLVTLVQNEYNPDNLARILDEFDGILPHQIIPEEIAQELRAINGAVYDEVSDFLRTTDDPTQVRSLAGDYLERWIRRVDEQPMTVPEGDIDAVITQMYGEELEAMGHLTEAQRKNSFIDFWDRVRFSQRQRDTAYHYATNQIQETLNALRGTEQEEIITTIYNQYRTLVANKNYAYGTNIRSVLNRYAQVLGKKNLDDIRALPGFADVANINDAWQNYYHIRDAVYETLNATLANQYMELANQARALTGAPARTFDDLIPASSEVFEFEKKTRLGISLLMNRVLKGGDFKSGSHMANWLHKNGLLDAAKKIFTSDDVTDLAMVQRFVDAVNETKYVDPSVSPRASAAFEQLEGLVNNRYQAYDMQEAIRPYQSIVDEILGRNMDDAALLQASQVMETADNPANMAHVQGEEVARLRSTLERLIDHVESQAGQTTTALTAAQRAAARRFITGMQSRLSDTRTLANGVGQATMDFILHNYSDRRNIDSLLGVIYSYPYWHTRNMMRFAERTFQQPGAVAALIKLRQTIRNMNTDLPQFWQDLLSFKLTPENIDGGRFFINILAFDPLNGFFGDKFRDADQRETRLFPNSELPVSAGTIINEMNQYGPSVSPILQYGIAAAALAQGNVDQALSWVGYTSLPTKTFRALTAYARAGADRILGEDRNHLIPAGGSILEPWLSIPLGDGVNVGDKWQRRRIGITLWEMVENEGVPYELAVQAAYEQENATGEALALFKKAAQRTAEKDGWRDIMGYMIASAVRPRSETEVRLAELDMERRAMYANYENMTAEERRQEQIRLNQEYPYADLVFMFRQDPEQRDTTLAWNVINRLPPNSSQVLEAAGINSEYLTHFYQGGLESMAPREREDFMLAIRGLSVILQAPAEATKKEWDDASLRRKAMMLDLDRQFPNAQLVVDEYYRRMGEDGPEGGQAVIAANPWLPEYFDTKDAMVAADPLLRAYYGSFDQLERLMWDNFYTQADVEFPGAADLSAQYGALMDSNPDAAYALLDENRDLLTGYWDAKTEIQIDIANALYGMGDMLNGVVPIVAGMVSNPDVQTAGDQRVADLLLQGPMGLDRFQLPEELEAETLKASLKGEINLIPSGMYGTVLRELEAMGGLDDTLNAFRAIGSVETVGVNLVEFGALLVALQEIRKKHGWDENTISVASSGRGGGSGTSRAKKSGGGGGGGSGKAPISDDGTIGDVLNSIKSSAPKYWGMLRNLADMTDEQIAAFLKDPANKYFVQFLQSIKANSIDLKAILDYFRAGKQLKPVTKTGSSSSTYKPSTRFSSRSL